MKKILMMAAAMLFATGLYAQTAYFSLGVGYLMQTNKTSSLGFEGNNSIMTDAMGVSTGSATANNFSLGGGIPISLDIGAEFNEHLAAGVNVGYFLGEQVEIANVEGSQDIGGGVTLSGTAMATAQTKQIRLTPFVRASTGSEDNISGFATFGLTLPVGGSTVREQTLVEPDFMGGSTTTFQKVESSGAFSVGFSSSIGVNFMLSDMMSVSAEVNHVSLAIKSDTEEVTELTVDGTSVLDMLPNYEKMSVFHDELTHTMNTDYFDSTVDPTKAHDGLRTQTSFSGVGLVVKLTVKPF